MLCTSGAWSFFQKGVTALKLPLSDPEAHCVEEGTATAMDMRHSQTISYIARSLAHRAEKYDSFGGETPQHAIDPSHAPVDAAEACGLSIDIMLGYPQNS